jgi:hypothetical protein
MFDKAFENIERMLLKEIDCSSECRSEQTLWSVLKAYLTDQSPERRDKVMCFLEQLEQLEIGSDHALARYLFSAATSEILCSPHLPQAPSRHFVLLSTAEPNPFLDEIRNLASDDWERNSRHQIRVQRETRSIGLFVRATRSVENRHDQYVMPAEIGENFTCLINSLEQFASRDGNGKLQLVRIVKLKARGQVYPHVDRGLYYLIRDRYHLVLQSQTGSRMQCESEISIWHPGQIWWFNNHVVHQAFNESDDERIHVVFDVLPERNQILADYLHKYVLLRKL